MVLLAQQLAPESSAGLAKQLWDNRFADLTPSEGFLYLSPWLSSRHTNTALAPADALPPMYRDACCHFCSCTARGCANTKAVTFSTLKLSWYIYFGLKQITHLQHYPEQTFMRKQGHGEWSAEKQSLRFQWVKRLYSGSIIAMVPPNPHC